MQEYLFLHIKCVHLPHFMRQIQETNVDSPAALRLTCYPLSFHHITNFCRVQDATKKKMCKKITGMFSVTPVSCFDQSHTVFARDLIQYSMCDLQFRQKRQFRHAIRTNQSHYIRLRAKTCTLHAEIICRDHVQMLLFQLCP